MTKRVSQTHPSSIYRALEKFSCYALEEVRTKVSDHLQ
jgi:hypothetical protein